MGGMRQGGMTGVRRHRALLRNWGLAWRRAIVGALGRLRRPGPCRLDEEHQPRLSDLLVSDGAKT